MGVNVSYIKNILEDGIVGFSGEQVLSPDFSDIKLSDISPTASDKFGMAVSMSDDVLVVGAPLYSKNPQGTGSVINAGAAFVFIRNKFTWEYYTTLIPSTRTQNEQFGWSVSVSDDSVIVIGTNGTQKAYIFEKTSNGYTNTQILSGTGNFGNTVFNVNKNIFVSDNTNSIENDSNTETLSSGAVFVYNKNSQGTWENTDKIFAPYGEVTQGDNLGYSIDFKNNFIAVSSISRSLDINNDNYLSNAGAVYILSYVNGSINLVQTIVSNNRSANSKFGNKVLFSSTGQLLISDVNNIYVYSNNGTEYEYSFTAYNSSSTTKLITDFDIDKYLTVSQYTTSTTETSGIFVYNLDFTNNTSTLLTSITSNTGLAVDYSARISTKDNLILVGDGSYSSNIGRVNLLTINSTTDSTTNITTYNISSQSVSASGNDRNAGDSFGTSVIYNETTNQIVASAPNQSYDTNSQNYVQNSGAVYIWNVNSDNTLSFSQKIVSSSRSTNAYWGTNISSNKNVIMVSQKPSTTSVPVDIFIFENSTWALTKTLNITYSNYGFYTDGDNIFTSYAHSGTTLINVLPVSDLDGTAQEIDISAYRENISSSTWYCTCSNGTLFVGFPDNSTDKQGLNPITNSGNGIVYKQQTDGTWKFYAKLTGWGQDRNANDRFGYCVKNSTNYLYISAITNPYDINSDNYLLNAGLVFVFGKNSDGSYSLIQKIQSNYRQGNFYFGNNIEVTTDENTLFISNQSTVTNSTNGWVEVYVKKNGYYTFSQYIGTPRTSPNTTYKDGSLIRLFNDNILFVSEINQSTYSYVYDSTTNTWNYDNTFSRNDFSQLAYNTSDWFGFSLSFKDNVLVIGAPTDTYDSQGDSGNTLSNAGSAYVYSLQQAGSTNNWIAIQKLSGEYFNISRTAGDELGYAVTRYNNYIIASMPYNDYDENGQNYIVGAGKVCVFEIQSDNSINLVQTIVEKTRGTNLYFGFYVYIYNDLLYILSYSNKIYEYKFNTTSSSFNINQTIDITSWGGSFTNVSIPSINRGILYIKYNYMTVYDKNGSNISILKNTNGTWTHIGETISPTNASDFPEITNFVAGWHILTDDLFILATSTSNTILVFQINSSTDDINYLYTITPPQISSDPIGNNGQFIQNCYVHGDNLFYSMNIGTGYILVYDLNGSEYTFSQMLSIADISTSLNRYTSSSTLFGNSVKMDDNGNVAVSFLNASYNIKSDSSKTLYNNAGAVILYKKQGQQAVNNIYKKPYTSDGSFTVTPTMISPLRIHAFGDSCSGNYGNYICFDLTVTSGDIISFYVGNNGKNTLTKYSGILDTSSITSGAATVIEKNGIIVGVVGGAPSIHTSGITNSFGPSMGLTYDGTPVNAGGAGYKNGSSSFDEYNPSASPGSNYIDSNQNIVENYFNISGTQCNPQLVSKYNLGNNGSVLIEYTSLETVSNFTFVQDITPTQSGDYGTSQQFGSAIDINDNILVVTSPNNSTDVNGKNVQALTNAGSAWIYEYTDSWNLSQKIVPTGTNARNSNDYFGSSCKIFNNMVVVSTIYHSYDSTGQNPNSLSNTGAAWVWAKSNNVWNQIDKLAPFGDSDISGFGKSLDMYNSTLAVGSISSSYDESEYNENYILNSGAVYILSVDTSNNLTFVQKIVSPARQAYGQFGWKIKFDQTSGKLYISEPGYISTGNTSYPVISGTIYEYTLNTSSNEYELSNTIVQNDTYEYSPLCNLVKSSTYGFDFDLQNQKIISSAINSQIDITYPNKIISSGLAPAGINFLSSDGYVEYDSNSTMFCGQTGWVGETRITLYVKKSFSHINRIISETTTGVYVEVDFSGDTIYVNVFDGTELNKFNTSVANYDGICTILLSTDLTHSAWSYTTPYISFNSTFISYLPNIKLENGNDTFTKFIIGPNSIYDTYDRIIFNTIESYNGSSNGISYSTVNFYTSFTPTITSTAKPVGPTTFVSYNDFCTTGSYIMGNTSVYDISTNKFIANLSPEDGGNSSGINFGYSVSIDPKTSNIVVGYPGDNVVSGSATSYDIQTNIGSAYVYEYNSTDNNYTFVKRIGTYGNDQYYPVSENKISDTSTTTENIYYDGYLKIDNADSYIKYNGPIYGTPLGYGISINVFIPLTASNKTRIFTQGTTYIDIDCTSSTPVVTANYIYGSTNTSTSISMNASKGDWWWIDFYYWSGSGTSNLRVNNPSNSTSYVGTGYSNQIQGNDFYIGPNSTYTTFDEIIIGGIAQIGDGAGPHSEYIISDGYVNYFDDYYLSNIGKDTAYTTVHPPANVTYIDDRNIQNYSTENFQQVIAGQTSGEIAFNTEYYDPYINLPLSSDQKDVSGNNITTVDVEGTYVTDSSNFPKYNPPSYTNGYTGNYKININDYLVDNSGISFVFYIDSNRTTSSTLLEHDNSTNSSDYLPMLTLNYQYSGIDNSKGFISYGWYDSSNTYHRIGSSSSIINFDSWNTLTLFNNSGTLQMFINGVLFSTSTSFSLKSVSNQYILVVGSEIVISSIAYTKAATVSYPFNEDSNIISYVDFADPNNPVVHGDNSQLVLGTKTLTSVTPISNLPQIEITNTHKEYYPNNGITLFEPTYTPKTSLEYTNGYSGSYELSIPNYLASGTGISVVAYIINPKSIISLFGGQNITNNWYFPGILLNDGGSGNGYNYSGYWNNSSDITQAVIPNSVIYNSWNTFTVFNKSGTLELTVNGITKTTPLTSSENILHFFTNQYIILAGVAYTKAATVSYPFNEDSNIISYVDFADPNNPVVYGDTTQLVLGTKTLTSTTPISNLPEIEITSTKTFSIPYNNTNISFNGDFSFSGWFVQNGSMKNNIVCDTFSIDIISSNGTTYFGESNKSSYNVNLNISGQTISITNVAGLDNYGSSPFIAISYTSSAKTLILYVNGSYKTVVLSNAPSTNSSDINFYDISELADIRIWKSTAITISDMNTLYKNNNYTPEMSGSIKYYNGIELTNPAGYVKYSAPVIGNFYSGNNYGMKLAILIPVGGGSNTTRLFSQPDVGSFIDITLTSTSATVSCNILGKTGSFVFNSTYFGEFLNIYLFATNATYFGIRVLGQSSSIINVTMSGVISNSSYYGNVYDTYIGNNSQYSTIDNIIFGGFEYISYYPDQGDFVSQTNTYLSLQSTAYSVPSLIDYTKENTTMVYNGFPVYEESKDVVPSTDDLLITQAQSISTLSTMVLPTTSTKTITSVVEQNYSVTQQNEEYMVYSYITDSYDYQGNNNLKSAGSVHIWTYDSTSETYKFTQRLTSPNREENGNFGNNIILGKNSLLVTASGESVNNIYIYKPTGTSPYIWELSDTINLTSYSISELGSIIDYDETNSQIAIGDINYVDITNGYYGRVIICSKTDTIWTFEQVVADTTSYKTTIDDKFGQEVKINGNNLAIKSNNNLDSDGNITSSENSLYIYNNESGTWTFIQKILANTNSLEYHSYTQEQDSSIELNIPNYLASGTGISLTVYISSSCGYTYNLISGKNSNNSPFVCLNKNLAGVLTRGSILYLQYTSSWQGCAVNGALNYDNWNTINIYNNSGTITFNINGIQSTTTTIESDISDIILNCNRHVILGGISYFTGTTPINVPYTTSNSNAYIDFSDMSSVEVMGDTSISIVQNNLVDNKITIDIPQKTISKETSQNTTSSTTIKNFDILSDTRLITGGDEISVYSQNSTTYEYTLDYSSDYISNNLTLVDTFVDRDNNTIWNNYYNSSNIYYIDCSDIGGASFNNTYNIGSLTSFITSVYDNYCITGTLDTNKNNSTQTILYRDITNKEISNPKVIYNGTNGNQNTVPTLLTYSNYILEDQIDELLYSDFYRGHTWGANVGSTQTTPNTSFYQNIGKYVKIYNDKIFTYCESDTYDEKGNMTGYFGNSAYGGGMHGNIGSVINLYKGSDGNYRYGKKVFGNLPTPTTGYGSYNNIAWFFGNMVATDTSVYLSLFHATTATTNSSIGYLTYPTTYRQDSSYTIGDLGIQYSSPLPWSYNIEYKTYNSGDFIVNNSIMYFGNWITSESNIGYSIETGTTWGNIQTYTPALTNGGLQTNCNFGSSIEVLGNNLIIGAPNSNNGVYIGNKKYSVTGTGVAYVYDSSVNFKTFLGTNQVNFGTGSQTWQYNNTYGQLTVNDDYLLCKNINGGFGNLKEYPQCIVYTLDSNGDIVYTGWFIAHGDDGPSSSNMFNTLFYPYVDTDKNLYFISCYGYNTGYGINYGDVAVSSKINYAFPIQNKNIIDGPVTTGTYSNGFGYILHAKNDYMVVCSGPTGTQQSILVYGIYNNRYSISDILTSTKNINYTINSFSESGSIFNYTDTSITQERIYDINNFRTLTYKTVLSNGYMYKGPYNVYYDSMYIIKQLPTFNGESFDIQLSNAGGFIILKNSSNGYQPLNQFNGSTTSLSSNGGSGGGYIGGYTTILNYGGIGGAGGYNYVPDSTWSSLISSDGITAPNNSDEDNNNSGNGGEYISDTSSGNGSFGHVVIIDNSGTKTQFTYTGYDQTYVVPSGITSITVKMWGAGGGAGYAYKTTGHNALGGAGGYVSGVINVSSSQIITIMVGQAGNSAYTNFNTNNLTTYNYGGGSTGYIGNSSTNSTGSGGGRSQISISGSIVAVAAGGGGGAITQGNYISSGGSARNDSEYFKNSQQEVTMLNLDKFGSTRNTNDYFGLSVYVIDKNTILIGAPGHQYDTIGNKLPTGQSGTIWKYTWKQQNNSTFWDITNKYVSTVVTNNFGSSIFAKNNLIYISSAPQHYRSINSSYIIGDQETSYYIGVYNSSIQYQNNILIDVSTDFHTTSETFSTGYDIDIDKSGNIIVGNYTSSYVDNYISLVNSGAVIVYSNNGQLSPIDYIVEPGLSNGRLQNDYFGISSVIYGNYILLGTDRNIIFVFKDNLKSGYDFVEILYPNSTVTSPTKFGNVLYENNGLISTSLQDSSSNNYIDSWKLKNGEFIENTLLPVSGSYNSTYNSLQLINDNVYIFGNNTDPRGTGNQPSITNAGTISISSSGLLDYYSIPGSSNGISISGDYYGNSVRILNGNLFVVGAPGHPYDINGNMITNKGAIYVYNIVNNTVSQETILSNTYSSTTYNGFGSIIKRVGDISFITGTSSNLVNVFKKVTQGNWTSTFSTLIPTNSLGSDIYSDGNIILVGNPSNNYITTKTTTLPYIIQNNQGGIAYYILQNGTMKEQTPYILQGYPSTMSNGQKFGSNISGVKNSIVISAPFSTIDDTGNTQTTEGNIYFYNFDYINGTSSFRKCLSNTTYNNFGSILSMSKDGSTVVVSGTVDTYDSFDIISTTSMSSTATISTHSTGLISSLGINEHDIISAGCQTYNTNTGIVELFKFNIDNNNWEYNNYLQAFINPNTFDNSKPNNFTTSPLVVENDYVGGHIYMNSSKGLVYSSIGNSTDQQGNNSETSAGAVFVVDVYKHLQ